VIIWLWLAFFAVALSFLFYGHRADDPTLLVLGWAFLWIPAWGLSGFSVPLITGEPGIQYVNGTTTDSVFVMDPNGVLESSTEVMSHEYASYHNRLYGLGMLFIAVMGLWMSITDFKNTPSNAASLPRIRWGRYRR
jgi:hypothetical protein